MISSLPRAAFLFLLALLWSTPAPFALAGLPDKTPKPATGSAPFDFSDLRVQATDEKWVAHQPRVKSGQTFYVACYLNINTPPREDEEAHFEYTFTLTDAKGGKPISQTVVGSGEVAAGHKGYIFQCQDATMSLLKKHPMELTIKVETAMQGVTRARSRKVTIMP